MFETAQSTMSVWQDGRCALAYLTVIGSVDENERIKTGGNVVMQRKRLTQLLPWLLPLRRWQRKKLFYLVMWLDQAKYAKGISDNLLPKTVFGTSLPMLNENSGFDMKYQYNKVHNLRLAARTIDRLLIEPGETFSFWQLVRWADCQEKYKDGLNLVNGKIVPSYGGGLCMLSDMLFWMFLHTPLTIVERHGHAVKYFPQAAEDFASGVDAAVSEGWLDLKVRNETDNTFQIEIRFDDRYMYGRILSQKDVNIEYSVFNSFVSYHRQCHRIWQTASVCRTETDKITDHQVERELYVNRCEIAYKIPESQCQGIISAEGTGAENR